jgi:hypothetical protein
MSFSQTQQAFTQQQIPPNTSGIIDRQHLTALQSASRTSILVNCLVQPTPIYILPNGSFSKLQGPSAIHLTNPQSQNDAIAQEATQIFYSLNEFAVSITTLSSFLSWTTNAIKPSTFITRLAVLYGPPTSPGGGNTELRGLIELPNLRSLRLIFQDYEFKGFGPYSWLRPNISTISSLAILPNLSLKLQLVICSRGPDSAPEDIDTDDERMKDVTSYLIVPTEQEERIVEESFRVCREYKGPRSSHEGILVEMGWSDRDAAWVVWELRARVEVKRWWEEEKRVAGAMDVEMSSG